MKELATAMAKAQAEIKAALKDSKNPHFKSSYADLTSVWDACRSALTKNGLSVIQIPNFDGDEVWLETMLLHSSGESITGRYPLRPQQQTPQGYGSALTYARRYSLAAMVGVVADEDDDGNAASAPRWGKQEPVEDKGLSAAKAFVQQSIVTLGAFDSLDLLERWLKTWAKHISQLEAKFPDQAGYLKAAIEETKTKFSAEDSK